MGEREDEEQAAVAEGAVTHAPDSTVSSEAPPVWGNVPQRNKHFTGRVDLLSDLRQQVTGKVTAVLAHALHGMGGVGKTQLAVEYAYRFKGDYQVVWWISADQIPLVRSSLAALAPRLEIDIPESRVEDRLRAVLDALRRGEPYFRWLVIFDNADQPEELLEFIPSGSGHVIVTSRNHRWESVADIVEVDVFPREESLEFLSRRVPGITGTEADRLAEELGDLPLALEQAGALQVEAGMSVDEYLSLLAEESSNLLAESQPTDYPVSVAAAWSLSMARLKQQMPFAWELLRRCAFFSPEPIPRDLLKNGRYVLGPPLQQGLADGIVVAQATRELGRYALARVDNNRKTLQVHRLIQRLIREDMDEEQRGSIRHEVHLLLAAADVDDPDETENWPKYEELLAHIRPSGVLKSTDGDARRLVRNVVRYLFNIGDLTTSEDLTDEALKAWKADSGPDDVDVLILSGHRATLLWSQGKYGESFAMRSDTLERMRSVLGEDHPETLLVMNGYGADLRAQGNFTAALAHDDETLYRSNNVFGADDPRTFNIANNVALDQGLNSRYEAALDTARRTHQDRIDFFGRNDHPSVVYSLHAIARELRQAGRYRDALGSAEQAYVAFSDLVRQRVLRADHPWVLHQAKELSVARRKMNDLGPALDLAEEVLGRYEAAFGARHPEALGAAMNFGNAQRVYGDTNRQPELMEDAAEQVDAAYKAYGEVYSPDHPYTYGCALNLAIVRRRLGDTARARQLLEEALTGLSSRLGADHHYTLICMTAMATSWSDTGDFEQARDLGEQAFEGLQQVLGLNHPHTLACAANLAIDTKAFGDEEKAAVIHADMIERYQEVLPEDHIDVKDAVSGRRIALDFEPPTI